MNEIGGDIQDLRKQSNFLHHNMFLIYFFLNTIVIESSSQSWWKTPWFIPLFPWNYEKRIISVQLPFRELQCNYFLKRVFLCNLLFQGTGIVVLWEGNEKSFFAQQQQIPSSSLPFFITVVWICLNSVKIMKRWGQITERSQGFTIKIHRCAKITMNSKCQEHFWFDHFIWYDMKQLCSGFPVYWGLNVKSRRDLGFQY